MRRKFVQIAAIFLVLSMLPTAFAAVEPDEGSNLQQNTQIHTAEEVAPSDDAIDTEDQTVSDSSYDPVVTEPDNTVTDPEQETTESGSEGGDPEQGTTEPGGEGDDPEQGTTEPGGEGDDPEQGTPEPDVPVVVVVPAPEIEEETGEFLRVGLTFGSSVMPSANLLNSTGSGYRFGFHIDNVFFQVGCTTETGISVLKTQNLYFTPATQDDYQKYVTTETSGPAVGCVHLQIPGTYATFAEAKASADALGGFPAWINGEFVVRYGTFLTADAAREAQVTRGLTDASIVGTSEYGFIVVKTGTNTPIFQYDSSSDSTMFVVKPGLDKSVKSVTYYRGIKYYGCFRYERIAGGDITVVNLVDLDDYVRGVIPYEMSPSWPFEALKAQAVAARSYALALSNPSHSRSGFDVCTSECCQVYKGTNGATAITDQAVDETAGQFALYDGKPILAVFHSSDGGATENCENVWFEALPYLRGVVDPYEALVADKINSYNWSKSYTGIQLQDKLNAIGYQCAEIVDVKLKNTDTGNVYSVTFVDSNGKNWTISKDSLRSTSMFGFKSLRFSLADDGVEYALTDNSTLDSLRGVWTLNGNGELVQISASPIYAVTAEGVTEVPGSELTGRTFVFNGTGKGHNLGMSQWGAYAMAKEGFTYDQILKFYFTGIEIHE